MKAFKEKKTFQSHHNSKYQLLRLSNPQMAIWYTERFYPNTSINNISATLRINSKIDFSILEQAINKFIFLNEGMRIRICEKDGESHQYISDFKYKKIDFIDFSKNDVSKLEEWETAEAQLPFFKFDEDLYKFYLLKINNQTSGFYVELHHIISDAWSMIMLGNEILSLYEAIAKAQEVTIKKQSYVYFLQKEIDYINSEKYKKDEIFWDEKFADIPDIASIKARKSKNISISAERKSFFLPEKLVKKLKIYSSEKRVSILSLFMSALAIYINRVTDKDDIIIGIPSINRGSLEEKEIVGLFVTTIPIRLKISNTNTYPEFLSYLEKEWLSVLRHHKYPLYKILRSVRNRYPGVDRLYDVLLSYQNAKFAKNDIDLSFDTEWHFQRTQNESLYIHVSDRENENRIKLEYDFLTEVFHGKDIEALHDHFIRILWHAIDAKEDRKIYEIEMVSENEKNLILHSFNSTKCDYPQDITMTSVFRNQAEKIPDETAVICNGKSYTYHEIDLMSEVLAVRLANKGIGSESIVALMMKRSIQMIVSILAVWKAGGAYMPVSPDFPAERIEYMLENSGAAILLSSREYAENIKTDIEMIDVFDETIYQHSGKITERLSDTCRAENLAYVIYTSGSTGTPKGVMIEHRALVNRINWMHKKYPIGENDVILQKTPYTFDVSVWELTWWFWAGAKMVFLEPDGEKNPAAIISAIEKYGVTTIHFVPSMLGAFLHYVESSGKDTLQRIHTLRMTFASGEALTEKHVERFNTLLYQNNSTTLHNLYGPTEAAIDVSYYDCSEDTSQRVIPIGKPIDNIQLYIVNKYMFLQPVGVSGELCIAGDGLARGYLNNQALTAEKFVDNPFEPGKRMYRTGDLARWFPKGDIEYLGRIDSQIKIRGFRIELGDIQFHLQQHSSVKDCVVTCIKEKEDTACICAYIVPSDTSARVNKTEINSYLTSKIPDYMIPQHFVILEKIPLSDNGKINFSRLPMPDTQDSSNDVPMVLPRNEIEMQIHKVWCNILGKSPISVEENFFSPNIGGDSITAIEVVCNLPKTGDCLIDITDFYQNPTISLLADFYSTGRGSGASSKKNEYLVLLTPNKKTAYSSERKIVNFICCPYGGASAFVYKDLAEKLHEIYNRSGYECYVYAMSLPGHRFDGENQNFEEDDTIISKIKKEIKAHQHFFASASANIIYSHCVGSSLGLRLAKEMENENYPVTALFTGGIIPEKFLEFYPKNYDPWKFAGNSSIKKYLTKAGLASNEFNDAAESEIMAAFRHDVKQHYKYMIDFTKKLNSPISAPIISVIGEKDPMTRQYARKFKAWQRYTYSKIKYVVIKNSMHYFIKTHAEELAEKIKNETAGYIKL